VPMRRMAGYGAIARSTARGASRATSSGAERYRSIAFMRANDLAEWQTPALWRLSTRAAGCAEHATNMQRWMWPDCRCRTAKLNAARRSRRRTTVLEHATSWHRERCGPSQRNRPTVPARHDREDARRASTTPRFAVPLKNPRSPLSGHEQIQAQRLS
jgi:hypothetical protein